MKPVSLICLLLGGSLPLAAQSPLEAITEAFDNASKNSAFSADPNGEQAVSSFFDEEDADIGPQYLLVPGTPAHDWFQAVADFQLLRSSNPTLDVSSVSAASDLAVATFQIQAQSPERNFLGGRANVAAGMRYQLFRYGTLSDTNIAGLPVDQNDFEGYSFFTNLNWRKNNWSSSLGLRWTGLDNDIQGSRFFKELVPTWELNRDFFTGLDTRIRLKYDLAYHATESSSFLPPFDDLNDRLAHSLSVSLLHRLDTKLYIEPTARVTYADYQGSLNGNREDTTIRLGASLSYILRENIQLRVFTGYQKRESNTPGIVDFENWDLGLGSTLSMRF